MRTKKIILNTLFILFTISCILPAKTTYAATAYHKNIDPNARYLFVGDSRTVGITKSVGGFSYICEVAKGLDWFKDKASRDIPADGTGKDLIVLLGINDLGNLTDYVYYLNAQTDLWIGEGYTLYFVSVGPVEYSKHIQNSTIEDFNDYMRLNLDPRWRYIDIYWPLVQERFDTRDGLHYTPDTYTRIYAMIDGFIQADF